ncbi:MULTISPECIES: hypothetical protein [Pseudomonas]|uniref:virion core protein, T7 gp14 family n=1 Tax=Pseudomonas TaxID=286 RepID=UPI0006962FAE|nr:MULTISPECIES: hypothetical protein [Pseudomonas]
MCDPTGGVATMAILAATSAAVSASDSAKAKGQVTDNERKQQNEVVKQANFADNDLKLQTAGKQDEARRQLTEVNLQRIRNEGTINALSESPAFQVTPWNGSSDPLRTTHRLKR